METVADQLPVTRAEHTHPASATRVDAHAVEPAPAQPAAYDWPGDSGASVHDALNEIDDDDPSTARSEGGSGGIALNWDDE
jgi:hypothetical protein